MCQEKGSNAKHGRIDLQNIGRKHQKQWRNLDVKDRLGLCLWAGKTIQRCSKTLCVLDNRRRFYWPLPIQEGLLRAVGYSNRISRTH